MFMYIAVAMCISSWYLVAYIEAQKMKVAIAI